MKPYDVDHILVKYKKFMLNTMKSNSKISSRSSSPSADNEIITDDMLKEQISKGWMLTKNSLNKDRVFCFNCGFLTRTKLVANTKCSFCHKQLTV